MNKFLIKIINLSLKFKNYSLWFINLALKTHYSFFFSVLGLCKPTKSTEDFEYEDDTPVDEDDEEAEEEDYNVSAADDVQPQIISQRMSIRVKAGSTVILPCQVMNAGLWNSDLFYSRFNTTRF